MASPLPTCASCGYVLPKSNFQLPCTNCGAVPRVMQTPAQSKKPLKLTFRQRWPGFLGWVAVPINRMQWFLRRIFSREILIFDLSRPGRPASHRPRQAPIIPLLEPPAHPVMENDEEIVLRPCPTDFRLLHSTPGHNGSGSGKAEQDGFLETPFPRRIPNC